MQLTLVLGASTNPQRFSHKAVKSLVRHQYPVVAVGPRAGMIGEIEILPGKPSLSHIDTISLYIGPARQKEFYRYILDLKPRRIIFNPGTENKELYRLAEKNGIGVVEGCALVMLNSGTY